MDIEWEYALGGSAQLGDALETAYKVSSLVTASFQMQFRFVFD